MVNLGDAISLPDGMPFSDIEPLAVIERRYVERVVTLMGGRIDPAARLLGISRWALIRRRKRWRALPEAPANR